MEIYKRGQGVYARGLAIVLFILTVGWLCLEVFNIPAEFETLVRVDAPLDEKVVANLVAVGIPKLRVNGLANQKLDMSVLGALASRHVDVGNDRVILADEAYTEERISKLQDGGVRFVPVKEKTGQTRDGLDVDSLLPGMVVKQPLMLPQARSTADLGTKLDVPLSIDDVKKIQQAAPPGGFMVKSVYRDKAGFDAKDGTKLISSLNSRELLAGYVLSEHGRWFERREIAIQGTVLDEAKIKEIQANRTRFPRITVEDKGQLDLTKARNKVKGRNLWSAEAKRKQTWMTKPLFTLPLVNLDISSMLLIAIGLFIVLVLLVLWTWNWKKWNDLLIETQLEMKKVSWPKRQELVGSSVIVIVMTLMLGFYLYVIDLILTFISRASGLYKST